MTRRPPFDPSKMKPPPAGAGLFSPPGAAPPGAAPAPPAQADAASSHAAPGEAADGAPITVSALAGLIDGALRGGLPAVLRVVGEVSNFTDRQHWYFALKDSGGVLNCVMFAFKQRGAGVRPRDGLQVVVTGRVEFYKPRGQVSFYVERLSEVGVGPLEAALRALVEEARGLGWLDESRKRALPFFPRRVAVITSRTGAALQDVLDTMRRRCPAVGVAFVDTLVQGGSAAPDVARAIGWVSANAARLGIDAVIVTRGGGSIEDLWAFNDREVARAIVACSVPVAAAIGHETDTTLAELVADARCATPTQAAMRLTPDRAALAEQLALLSGRAGAGQRRSLRRAAEHLHRDGRELAAVPARGLSERGRTLAGLSARLERCRPVAVLERRRAALAAMALRLATAGAGSLRAARSSDAPARLAAGAGRAVAARASGLDHLARQLALVGPAGVIRRGFSVTFDELGRLVRRTADAPPGTALTTRLIDGEVRSVVAGDGGGWGGGGAGPGHDAREPGPAPAQSPEAPARPPRRRRGPEPDGAPGLFG